MYATVEQLAARALRKLGIAIVADAQRPRAEPISTVLDVAGRVMRELGVPVAESGRHASTDTVGLTDVAIRTMRAVGLDPIGPIGTVAFVPPSVPARRALLLLGVNPMEVTGPSTSITFSSNVLARNTLLRLSRIAPDETPDALSLASALTEVQSVHDRLVTLDYVSWDLSQVPASAAPHYVTMASVMLAQSFGLPMAMDSYTAAQEMIRLQALSGDSAQTRAEARVISIHETLTASGMAAWSVYAIPLAVVDAYAAMVAHLLSSVHGRPGDPNAMVAGMAAVRRYDLSGPRGQVLAENEVSAVHDALVMQGLASWPVSAIPVAQAGHYVVLAVPGVMRMAFGAVSSEQAQVDAAAHDSAMTAIRKIVVLQGAEARTADRVRAVASELNALGLVVWDADHIPAAASDALASMTAMQMGPEFGRPMDAKTYAELETRIRRISMGGAAGQALAEQKIRAVQASLESRGYARWTIHDVPFYAEEPMVFMAATWLAPECGVPADPKWWTAAELDINRITSLPSAREPARALYF